MRIIFSNPDLYFYWFDVALTLCIYTLSIILFLKHKRGYITPLLFFGLFIFPLQFSMWFLSDKFNFIELVRTNFFEIFYLLFIKFCLILTIILARR